MAAPTVIKWSDTDVPELKRTSGSLIAILDFCLPQRGWVKEFSGTGKAVYRAGTGERKFYRVLDDGSVYYNTTYYYTIAEVRCYDSMTDVDTGAGLTGPGYISKSLANITTAHPWVCIFDEKGFHFVSFPHLDVLSFTQTTAIGIPHYAGETIPCLPGETPRNVIMGSQPSKIPQYGSSLCTTGGVTTGNFCNRSIDGTRANITPKMLENGGVSGSSGTYPVGNSSTLLLSYPYYGAVLYGQSMLDDALSYSMGDLIPGFFYPCVKAHSLDTFQIYPDGSKSLMAFRVHSTSGDISSIQGTPLPSQHLGAILIDISAGFRP